MSSFKFNPIPQEDIRIPGENYFNTLTPYFRHESVLDVAASERENRPVHKIIEGVEVRFAANPQYKPFFPVDAMYRRHGVTVITWAERFKKQYEQFLAGAAQEAEGTPLEELQSYGITPAQLSMCRALSIYSIEALYHLEGAAVKRLGVHANDLKPMAKRYMAAKADGSKAERELAELRAEVEKLRAAQDAPAGMAPDELSIDLPAEVPELPEGYESMTDDELKSAIADVAGARPRGNPSRATLISMAREVGVAA